MSIIIPAEEPLVQIYNENEKYNNHLSSRVFNISSYINTLLIIL